MKKVILLIMSVLLIVAFAVPAMADVSWSGRLLGSMVTGFAPKEGKAANSYYYLYTDLIAEVDEYNTLTFEFGGYVPGANWTVDAAYIDTDLGAYFGLPVGLVSTFGSYWATTRKYEATGHATERAPIRQANQINGIKAMLDFGMGDITVLTSIGDNFGGLGQTLPVQAVIVTLPELGPVDLEAFMYGTGQEEFKPLIGVDAKVAFDPVSVAAGFGFDLAKGPHIFPGDAVDAGEEWAYGVGVKADLGMFYAGAALNGNSVNALNSVTLEAGAEVMENVGVDVGVGLSLADGADTFQGAEISAYVSPGAATWRIGYIITTTAEYSYQSVVSQEDGGLFVQGDLSF